MYDLISRQAAIDALGHMCSEDEDGITVSRANVNSMLKALPSSQPEGYIKIPKTGIDDLSDGFHTFRQLYYQRMMLFATIVKQNKDKAWKSLRHEDGELCFGGGWFIVGIDTPEGSYTYHYEDNCFSLFDCEELEHSKHWDGHTEKDVTRLLSLPSAQPEPRWTPCSERLPDKANAYIVTDYSGDVVIYFFYDTESSREYWRRFATAWMPLPEPYKGEES